MKNKITILCLMAICAVSCEKNVVHRFEDQSSLYFYKGAENGMGVAQNDSIIYSFYLMESSVLQDTVWLDVRLTGMPSQNALPLPISQINTGGTNATIAGTHYIAFDDPGFAAHMVLPAGKVSIMFPVVLLRTPDMRNGQFKLDIGIGVNEHFTAGIIGQTTFIIKVSDNATKPLLWDAVLAPAFGQWGQVKMKFIIDYLGFTDFDTTVLYDDMVNYWKAQAQLKLVTYEAAYGPLYEDDGLTRVIF